MTNLGRNWSCGDQRITILGQDWSYFKKRIPNLGRNWSCRDRSKHYLGRQSAPSKCRIPNLGRDWSYFYQRITNLGQKWSCSNRSKHYFIRTFLSFPFLSLRIYNPRSGTGTSLPSIVKYRCSFLSIAICSIGDMSNSKMS